MNFSAFAISAPDAQLSQRVFNRAERKPRGQLDQLGVKKFGLIRTTEVPQQNNSGVGVGERA